MIKNILLTILLLLFANILFAQNKSANETELSRIREISAYSSLESFARAKDLNRSAQKGDLVVLQDDTRKLYYGIIDSVRSSASIGIILYNEKNEREVVEATYEDLYYLKSTRKEVKSSAPEATRTEPGIAEKLAGMEEELKKQDQKINQLTNMVESAGRSYETSDILMYATYIGFGLGSAISAIGSFSGSTAAQALGGAMVATSLGTSIGSIVMRFSGHKKLKNAGRMQRR